MATLDKEIKIMMLKGQKGTDGQDGQDGQDGKSSYDLAVEELHYSGTLEEWINSFSTPENYITRNEFKKVTQEEYDELVEQQALIPNCYYIITDDTTYDDLIDRIEDIESDISDLTGDVGDLDTQVTFIQGNYEYLDGRIDGVVSDINNINADITDLQNKTAPKPYTNISFYKNSSGNWVSYPKELNAHSTYVFTISLPFVTLLTTFYYHYTFILHVEDTGNYLGLPYNSSVCNMSTYGTTPETYDNNIYLLYSSTLNSQQEIEWRVAIKNLPDIPASGIDTIYGYYYKIDEVNHS